MTLPERSICLYADGAQNPVHFDRGITRFVVEHIRAIKALVPDALDAIYLNPSLPLTGNLSSMFGSELLTWSGERRAPDRGYRTVPPVYHIMSPFEATPLEVMWPWWARDPRVATVVTLYDLIPLIFADQYLQDPVLRIDYTARLDLIRAADQVLALSQTSADDGIERLGLNPERVHVIHAGATQQFADMYGSSSAAWAHLGRALPGVRPGFVMYVGGFDFRKNLERTIAAFGRLPADLRARHQLVIVCRLAPDAMQQLRNEADRTGIEPDQLLLTGYISDTDLGALYRACTLFVFPSLYEGSGLPMLEAMSCGAPVAASAASTSPEILGDAEATFDPLDPGSIAGCLAEVLSSEPALERLRARSARRVACYTWRGVAAQTLEAYERCVQRHPRRQRRRRPRLALITPWSPDRCRTSSYSAMLATALAHQQVDVDVVVASAAQQRPEPLTPGVRLLSAAQFRIASTIDRHDRVLYCIGGSPEHRHVYELLSERPGAVLFHEVLLTGFYDWYSRELAADAAGDSLMAMLKRMCPSRVMPSPALDGLRERAVWLRWGVYMSRVVQSGAEECFVHSRYAKDVLELDRGVLERAVPVTVVPLALPPPTAARDARPAHDLLIAGVGQSPDTEQLATLIQAFGMLATEMPAARLVIADRSDPKQLERWHQYAGEHARGCRVAFRARVSDEDLAVLLADADLAVQLRSDEEADSSGVLADCLSHGLPTIASALGWPAELPEGTILKVPVDVEPHQLRDQVRNLIADEERRRTLSKAAQEYASNCSFARVAGAYIDALGLRW
ncbi:MAG: glycosyltransferase [Solirubrobacteraceae bacterium]